MTEQRYAHEIAPPVARENFNSNRDLEGLAAQQVAYHAARSYGFYLFAYGFFDHKDATAATMHMLAHYELAALYWAVTCTDDVEINAVTADIANELDSPHVIGPNLHEMLSWANIDPAEIKPYGGAR